MMLFPHYDIWKPKWYGIVFGYIWSFWAAVPKGTFNSELEISTLVILFYFMLVAALVPALFFTLIAFVLSRLYCEKYLIYIQKGVGWLALLISLLLFFGILKTPTL